MHFLTFLKSGVSVKNTALEFVQELLKRSWRENELCLDMACDFVHDILAAIGLECVITPEQINAGGTYVWPMDQIHVYNFHYKEIDFKKLEEFLEKVCLFVKLQNEIYINGIKPIHNGDIESPVEYLMQLVAVWCNVYKQLQRFEDLQTNKRFEEPLARINFHLLLGMHEIRKIYRLDLCLLDAICNRLYWSAVQGLFYKQTHDMVFSGLLEIFSKNFDLFYTSSPPTMNFFYEAFAVQINKSTPLILYKALQSMLLEIDTTTDKLNILLDFLIEPYMLQVYFTTFLAKKSKFYVNIKKIQQEAITFLNILQSKLLTLDCFSREFMEAILNLVFKTEHAISNAACILYITMMKRKFSNQTILTHIMDFSVARASSVYNLKAYVQVFCGCFESIFNINNILEIITNHQTTEIIRILGAQIITIVFELKLQKRDDATNQELHYLLQILPEIFENLSCQKTQGILLNIYSFTTIEKLQKKSLNNFIHYAVGIFTYTESSLEYPLLMNIFSVFHKCLIHNNEWQHLELLSEHLFNKYQAIIKNLKQMEEKQQKLLTKGSLEQCNNIIKRFNIILKTKYDILDNNYMEIIRHISHYFLYNLEIKTLITESKSLIDLYTLEIIISCILKLLKQKNAETNQNYKILPELQELFNFLWLTIKNLDELLKLPIVRIKTYFCCFLQLLIHLPFKLDNHIYHQLVQILIMVNFKSKLLNRKDANELQQLHPLQSLEYQRLMLGQFTQMHKYQNVQINTNMVWKLCIYYEMFKHSFQEELKNLIITLANYRLKIYKHIISVLIYNLYNQNPALKHTKIVSMLKQHKHLIDNDIKVESSELLKVHVVLIVLQILEKTLIVQRIKTGRNRLEALKHLYIFIEDLDLNQYQAKQLIDDQLNKLRKHLIVAEECKLLADFEKLLNKQMAVSKQLDT